MTQTLNVQENLSQRKATSIFPYYPILFFFSLLLFFSCGEDVTHTEFFQITGPTMGTSYSIVFESEAERGEFKEQVDSLLIDINDQLSTWITESVISKFNQSDSGIKVSRDLPPYFLDNLKISEECYRWTDGWFDPTVMPLVNYWGFGFRGREAPESIDSQKIDSLLTYVGWGKIILEEIGTSIFIRKNRPETQLDFSAVAKGYGVDVLTDFLSKNGVENYLVDIGGELCVSGPGRHGDGWVLGVNSPDPSAPASELSQRFRLKSGCVATSGNYRNFREVEGTIIGHTINPKTGFPEINRLLSATIWFGDGARADALATAALAMGYPAAMEMTENIDGAEGFFIFINANGEAEKSWTKGFEKFLTTQ